ncbi:glycosyltransferase family 2 protein [Ornithinimicrobium faecis]|uniref:glycosyltransferase family 2 protein n=1 Tax=Ornithinimicrobium faecis TaxID=2934158 RepID=UPI002118D3DB|nr:glycosyltransferase family 2 protein [Ornithinimicrobium sp. HY1745]
MPDASAATVPAPRPTSPPQDQPGYRTAWQLWHSAERPDALAHLALRTKSPVVLDALALAATGGALTLAQLRAATGPRLLPDRASELAALALALAGMGRSVEDLHLATDLYLELRAGGALPTLSPIHHQSMGQALFLSGRHQVLRKVVSDLTKLPDGIRQDLETDLANPHLSGDPVPAQDHARWVELLGSRFRHAGLEAPRVEGAANHLFDRLSTDPALAGTVRSGPLVSVIMPCFQPDEGLLTSIASISNQTWGDLEILVVDDASGQDHEEIFAAAVASDERARLVRMERNGGSYLGRNAALEQARGEFITFQDADDWSHPRRLEQQVRLLLEDEAAPASRSQAVRAKDDLTHQWFGYRSLRDNASSLMLRRSVIEAIGPFAPIRKGADSEYAERVTSRVGPVLDTGTPLAITRLRTGTLSRGDFTYQWSTPERLVFKGSYRASHRRDGLGFPVPRSFLRGLPHAPTWESVPVAYLGDLSGDPTAAAESAATGESAEAGARLWREVDGLPEDATAALPRVGLWHLESPTPPQRKRAEMHDAWFDRIVASDGQLVPLTRLEPVVVERLVVLDPAVLLLAGAQPVRLEVSRVEVRLSPAVLEPDASGLAVDLLEVGDVCRSAWGSAPRWVVEPGLADAERAALEDLVPGLISP